MISLKVNLDLYLEPRTFSFDRIIRRFSNGTQRLSIFHHAGRLKTRLLISFLTVVSIVEVYKLLQLCIYLRCQNLSFPSLYGVRPILLR